mmetsp:Transcript_8799/g.19348  ORF Transcript_8799/g.19348 Transcript_8799/m.19348 type:complete len:239 (-) Transcript_8799:1190-1906(-)
MRRSGKRSTFHTCQRGHDRDIPRGVRRNEQAGCESSAANLRHDVEHTMRYLPGIAANEVRRSHTQCNGRVEHPPGDGCSCDVGAHEGEADGKSGELGRYVMRLSLRGGHRRESEHHIREDGREEPFCDAHPSQVEALGPLQREGLPILNHDVEEGGNESRQELNDHEEAHFAAQRPVQSCAGNGEGHGGVEMPGAGTTERERHADERRPDGQGRLGRKAQDVQTHGEDNEERANKLRQ